MGNKELEKRMEDLLREKNVRKEVRAIKVVLHISDDEGNEKDFSINKKRTDVRYNRDDAKYFLEAFMTVVTDALLNGEEVRLPNFGTFKLKKKKASRARHPLTGELVDVPAYYYPTFSYARRLKNAAKFYGENEKEREAIDYMNIDEIYDAIDAEESVLSFDEGDWQ